MSYERPKLKHGHGEGGMKLPLCPECRGRKLDLLTLEPFLDVIMAKGRIRCLKCDHEWEGTFEDPQVTLDVVHEALRTCTSVLEDLEHGGLGRRFREAKKQLDDATHQMNDGIGRVERELLSRFPNRVATVEIEITRSGRRILAWEKGLFLVTIKGSKANRSPLLNVSRRVRTVAMGFMVLLYEELAA